MRAVMPSALDLRSDALRGLESSQYEGVDECDVEGGVEEVFDVGLVGARDFAELDQCPALRWPLSWSAAMRCLSLGLESMSAATLSWLAPGRL